ncbi:MAG: hypothetical protein M1836_007452 [Candelina mexicana]|nr:MAG: hypothetical protein M1836_007452 [Candelina mexicana]
MSHLRNKKSSVAPLQPLPRYSPQVQHSKNSHRKQSAFLNLNFVTVTIPESSPITSATTKTPPSSINMISMQAQKMPAPNQTTQNKNTPKPTTKATPKRQSTKWSPWRQNIMAPSMTKTEFQSLLVGEEVNIFLGNGDARGIAFVRHKKLLCRFSPLCNRKLVAGGERVLSFNADFTPENKAMLGAVFAWMANGGDSGVKGPNTLNISGLGLTELLRLVHHLEIAPLVNFLVDHISATIPGSDCTTLFSLLKKAKEIEVKPLEARVNPAINRRLALMGINTLLDMYQTCENLGLEQQKHFIVELLEPKFRLWFLSPDHLEKTYKVSKAGAPLRTLVATSIANRMVSRKLKTPKAFIDYAQKNEEFRVDIFPIMAAFDAEGVPCHLGERRQRPIRKRAGALPTPGRNNRKRAETLPAPETRPQNIIWRVKTESQRVKPVRPGTLTGALPKTLEQKKAEILAELTGKPSKAVSMRKDGTKNHA